MKCGVIFNKCFAANLLENLIVKKFEHRLRINRVTAVSVVSPTRHVLSQRRSRISLAVRLPGAGRLTADISRESDRNSTPA